MVVARYKKHIFPANPAQFLNGGHQKRRAMYGGPNESDADGFVDRMNLQVRRHIKG